MPRGLSPTTRSKPPSLPFAPTVTPPPPPRRSANRQHFVGGRLRRRRLPNDHDRRGVHQPRRLLPSSSPTGRPLASPSPVGRSTGPSSAATATYDNASALDRVPTHRAPYTIVASDGTTYIVYYDDAPATVEPSGTGGLECGPILTMWLIRLSPKGFRDGRLLRGRR